MNSVTRLWHISEDGKRTLMNTITSTSQFFGFTAPRNLHLEEQRTKCAEIIRDGWINQGSMKGTWEIEQGKPDPVVFSKMADDLLTSRTVLRDARGVV